MQTTRYAVLLRLQEAYIWAWGTHFKPLAADLNYCLECLPVEGEENVQSSSLSSLCAFCTSCIAALRSPCVDLTSHPLYLTTTSLISPYFVYGMVSLHYCRRMGCQVDCRDRTLDFPPCPHPYVPQAAST